MLDTHAWIWWISNPEQLSEAARQSIDSAAAEKAVYISSISVWEVALLVEKGRLQFNRDVRDWIAQSEALPILEFRPVNNHIGIQAVRLPGDFHKDPADRIIVATALALGAAVVSKDARIRGYEHVETIW